jgi:alpha-ketoglutarate-dependent taurine dioxygenase
MRVTTDAIGKVVEPDSTSDRLPVDPKILAELLSQGGCVLLRGFASGIEDFEKHTSALGEDFKTYQGGGFSVGPLARSAIDGNKTILTATGSTQHFAMALHGEMYYLSTPPDLIWFYCAIPPTEGGETTIGDGVKIFDDLPKKVAKLLQERQVRYERRLTDGEWQATYATDSRSEVEEFCKAQNVELNWDEAGTAITSFRASALRRTPAGKTAFINSVLLNAKGEQAYRSGLLAKLYPDAKIKPGILVRWEDGLEIESDIIDQIDVACTRNEVAVPWSQGDVLLVDNRSVMHGRRASDGKDRKILVRMGKLKSGFASSSN